MPRRSGRAGAAAAALSLLAVVSLAGCSGSGEGGGPADRAATAQPSTVGRTSSDRTCPQLDRAQPRDDGLPDLDLPCLEDGPSVNLADLRGTPTVLNVWAAWCTNCDREMPLFADAMDRAGDRLRFFGVHYKATRAQGRTSEDDFGVPFPSAHDGDGDLTVARLRATAPPQTFFVSADGKVVGRKVGEITSQDELDGLVEQYLGVRL
ncbi:MAG TPA: TlpA disulfide reductase family protein [Actinomycetes bacterium]|nr:TlpA disulfide reductase family protein [Actinomycetes bacterium]